MGCQQNTNIKNEEQETPKPAAFKKSPTQDQLSAHEAKAFMITCMDFRLIDDDVKLMDSLGYNNNYDEFVLAGGSLGFVQQEYPYWATTALDHMEIGLKLHHFRQIIIIDHFDCGAYKKFMPYKNREEELKNHQECIQKAHDLLKARYPNFSFRAFLMDLYGKATEVTVKA
jgi:carbonic anhydrase